MSEVRRRSPKAPSVSLGEAIDKAKKIFDKDQNHPIPRDVAAKHLGYSGERNGAALKVLGTLKMFGLLESPAQGTLAVPRSLPDYLFAPDAGRKRLILKNWLENPPLFHEIFEKYNWSLPSQQALVHTLITEYGFTVKAAERLQSVLQDSVEFVNQVGGPSDHLEPHNEESGDEDVPKTPQEPVNRPERPIVSGDSQQSSSVDRIPIRLRGGRKAWLEVPQIFHEADKEVIKAQVDLIMPTEDED